MVDLKDLSVEASQVERAKAVFEREGILVAKNLLPAHEMGMATVLVRHAAEWAQDGADAAHVHHMTDDLVAWLTDVTAG